MTKLQKLFGDSMFLDGAPDTSDWSTNAFLSSGLGTTGSATAASATPATALYLTEAGDTTAISLNDIHQGQIGDCFLLSSIGEIAMVKPTFISGMIHANSNGSETVTLYEASNGTLPTQYTTAFRAVTETVTNVFPSYAVNDGATQDVVNGVKEIWPQVLENAVAQLNSGYAGIANGGSPVIAMEELTGKSATFLSPKSMTQALLQSFSAQGDLVVMDTPASGALLDGLVNDHAYMFEGVTGSGANAAVKLGNPWGTDQPAPVLLSQLTKGIAEVDVGRLA